MEYIPKEILDKIGSLILLGIEQAQKKKSSEMRESIYFIEFINEAL